MTDPDHTHPDPTREGLAALAAEAAHTADRWAEARTATEVAHAGYADAVRVYVRAVHDDDDRAQLVARGDVETARLAYHAAVYDMVAAELVHAEAVRRYEREAVR